MALQPLWRALALDSVRRCSLPLGVLLAATAATTADAQVYVDPSVLNDLQNRLDAQERMLERQRLEMEQQRRQLELLRSQILQRQQLDQIRGAGLPPVQPYVQRPIPAVPGAGIQTTQAAPRPVAPVPVAPQPVAPQPVAPQPAAPQPVAPQPAAPQPVSPQPVAPQPVAPQPVAPETPQPVETPPVEAPAPEAPTETASTVREPDQGEQLLLEAGGILLRPGRLQIEPSLEYSHFSSDRVVIAGFTIFEAIIIGTIRVDDLERDILTAALTARYGLTRRLQIEARLPYTYRRDDEILGVGTADQEDRQISADGIGDIEGTISYQALFRRGWIPDAIVRVRGKARNGRDPFDVDRETTTGGTVRLDEPPIGSGFFAVSPGATFVWRTDPVVFFTGGSYTFNLQRDFGEEFGEIDPGDSIQYFGGMNIALSDRAAINFSFINDFTMKTKQGDVEVPGTDTNDARIVLGASVGLTQNMSLLVSAAAGLTDESPDFQFTVSVPINFDLF